MQHLRYAVFFASDEPLDAARQFHEQTLPGVRDMIGAAIARGTVVESLIFVFSNAAHTHRGWRLAAVQALAREFTPMRVNAVEGDSDLCHDSIEEVSGFLQEAPGITGQVLAV